MLTHLLRVFIGQQLKLYLFKKATGFLPDFNDRDVGLYVHVPFCKALCDFCPYYKETFEKDKFSAYLKALSVEIDIAGRIIGNSENKFTTLYFGGGSPALAVDYLENIRRELDDRYVIKGLAGIELHPQDIEKDTSKKLLGANIDMVSVGIQSFDEQLLNNLGREYTDGAKQLKKLCSQKFKAVDIDLIFGIPGQTRQNIQEDFSRAVDLGATQISAYPFIDFSYANNRNKPLGNSQKKDLLDGLLEIAWARNFIRTSVWTFGKKDSPRYSSVTRDCFLGFGPSAASLGNDAFKMNTFSVDSYIDSLNKGRIPTVLKMEFTPRTRRAYWLFWNCYNGVLNEDSYFKLFETRLKNDFSFYLKLGEKLKLFKRTSNGWELTMSGSYYFHIVEQSYTHQYIDKTWRASMETPWPKEIRLY
ncbi:radical SAM protein [candidate division WOR-3 bacterium]|nr:radical SAM protein [candidate division WOR-3 bacterium]